MNFIENFKKIKKYCVNKTIKKVCKTELIGKINLFRKVDKISTLIRHSRILLVERKILIEKISFISRLYNNFFKCRNSTQTTKKFFFNSAIFEYLKNRSFGLLKLSFRTHRVL